MPWLREREIRWQQELPSGTLYWLVVPALVMVGLLFFMPVDAHAAGEQIGTAIDRVTAWIRGILIALGILAFIIGAGFFMIEGTTGSQERGKTIMVAAVVGVLLGFLAGPIVDLAASFVR